VNITEGITLSEAFSRIHNYYLHFKLLITMYRLKISGNKFLFSTFILSLILSFNSFTELKSSNSNIETVLSVTATENQATSLPQQVYTVVESMPYFPGGDAALFQFIRQNILYPEEAYKNKIEGKVVVQFVVSETGTISDAKVIKKLSPDLDEEALRVVNTFPAWTPGKQNGKNVPVYFTLPIVFKYTPNLGYAPSWDVNTKTVIVIDSLRMPANFNLNVLNSDWVASVDVLKPFPEETKAKLIQQYGSLAENGVIVIKTHLILLFKNPVTNLDKPESENNICKDADKMPEFPGGEIAILNFISKSLKYPVVEQENGVQGKGEVRFVVDTNGRVKNPRVIRSVSPALDTEALRVVNTLPDFTPAEKDGKKVDVYCTLPFSFRLEGEGFSNRETEKPIVVLDDQKLPEGFNPRIIDYEKLSSYKTFLPTSKAKTSELIEKYGAEASHGVTVFISKKELPATKETSRPTDSIGNHIYQVIEEMPVFMGGEHKLMKFIEENLRYPKSALADHKEGSVLVRFIVNSIGNIEKPEIMRGLDPDCDKEALRIVNSFPVWIPGRQHGVNVSVYFALPIRFRLN